MLGALIGTALMSLRHHLLRSILTMLGIIFGVAAVVAMTAISEGARAQSLSNIESMGLQNVLLRSQPPTTATRSGDRKEDRILRYGITEADRQRIAAVVTDVERTVSARAIEAKVFAGDQRIDAHILATEPAWSAVGHLTPARGRFFTALDLERRSAVAVIGDRIAREVFRWNDPIGQQIKVGEIHLTVVGVLALPAAGAAGLSADELRRAIFLPSSTARSEFGALNIRAEVGSWQVSKVDMSHLVIGLADGTDVIAAGDLIRATMKKHHDIQDYDVVVPLELLEQQRRTQRIFAIVMSSIASISLIVGGIGIMNIMLATVLERTREIGIRRAIGARRTDILLQFLVETITLSVLGGLGGLALGVGGAVVVSSVSGWPTIVSAWSMVLAVAISALVGMLFGLYPAAMAARMQPVEALRHA
jgi:putative ABC transport system permease protein